MSQIAKSIIKKYSKAEIVKTEDFNTNNDWGYGGGVGKETVYDNGYSFREGVASWRDGETKKFKSYYKLDEDNIPRRVAEDEFLRGIGEVTTPTKLKKKKERKPIKNPKLKDYYGTAYLFENGCRCYIGYLFDGEKWDAYTQFETPLVQYTEALAPANAQEFEIATGYTIEQIKKL